MPRREGDISLPVLERRRNLAQMIFMGRDKKKAFEEMAELYDVKVETIERDWCQRKGWLRNVFDIDCDDEVIEMILAEQRWIRDKYMSIYQDAKSESTKLGCLNSIRECNAQMVKMMQDLGVLDKQADKLELSGELEMTSLAKKVDEWALESVQENK